MGQAEIAIWCASMGVFAVFTPFISAKVHQTKVHQTNVLVSGPIAGTVAMYGLSQFMRAHQRDALILRGMQLVCAVSALSVLAVLWPNHTQALKGVALVMLFCSVASFWLVLRAALLGDKFAWPMAAQYRVPAYAPRAVDAP